MNILELLLNNWFVVVILYIVATSIWKNVKARTGEGGNKPAPKQAMPPFGGGGSGGWGKTVKQAVTKAGKPSVARSEQPRQSPNVSRQEPVNSPQTGVSSVTEHDFWEESPLTGHSANQSTDGRSSSSRRSSQLGHNRVNPIESDTLAQAVVWAEILGPPRAKKPFRK